MMKKIYYLTFLMALFACEKEDFSNSKPSDLANMKVEPRVGGTVVKWSLPADSNFLYLEVRHLKKDKVVTTKVSKYTDSLLVGGLLNKLEYTFEMQPFNASPKGAVGGSILTSNAIRPIRRPIETLYLVNDLTKLTVTESMIDTYTQESTEGPKRNLIDGDRNTYWHTAWSSDVQPLPHWVKIAFTEATKLGAIKYYFRNNTTQNGRPTQFALETSNDGTNWTRVWTSAAGLSVTTPVANEITLPFDKNYTAKYFRVMIIAAQGNTTWVALGDMSFYSMGEQETDLEQLAETNY